MNRKLLRATLLGLIVLAALFSAAPTLGGWLGIEVRSETSPAADESVVTSGFCAESGIAVVIDFGSASGRKPQTNCVQTNGATGWELLSLAHHSVTGTTAYPIGFVCRIDDWPMPQKQDCADTPTPSEGTWVYYYATGQMGNHWLFSGQGAASRKPECGSVEGWRFVTADDSGDAREPRIKPATVSCH